MDEPSPFDNKRKDWEDIFGNIFSIVSAISILTPICLGSLYISIMLIQSIIALF